MQSRTNNAAWRYGYQGEYAEKDTETGWNAFELRMYDAAIGRWLSVDKRPKVNPGFQIHHAPAYFLS